MIHSLLVIAVVLPIIWLYMVLQGAPYRASQTEAIKNMLKLAGNVKGKKVAELGSGDGRIVQAFAKAGANINGYEINPLLVFLSRQLLYRSYSPKQARIIMKNFWKADLSQYDIIIVFGLPFVMKRLENRDLKPGAIVISNLFVFPSREISRQVGTVYRYDIK